MDNFLISRSQVTQTVEFIFEQYEKAQLRRLAEMREIINPTMFHFRHFIDCFDRDWLDAHSKIQGLSLLLEDAFDSRGLVEFFEISKDKVSALWKSCGVELRELQFPEHKASTDIDLSDTFIQQVA